jgi:hypothetical protein
MINNFDPTINRFNIRLTKCMLNFIIATQKSYILISIKEMNQDRPNIAVKVTPRGFYVREIQVDTDSMTSWTN